MVIYEISIQVCKTNQKYKQFVKSEFVEVFYGIKENSSRLLSLPSRRLSLVNFESQYCFIGKLTKRNHLYALQAKLQPMLFGGLWTDDFSILKTGIMLSSGMRRHTFIFVRKRGYTLHIDAPDGGTKMETEKVYAMPFCKKYILYWWQRQSARGGRRQK